MVSINSPDEDYIDTLRAELASVTAERDKLRRRIAETPAFAVRPVPGTNGGFGFVVTTSDMIGKRVSLVKLDESEGA